MSTHVHLGTINELVAAGYLTCRRHPTESLLIVNYTSKTQYEAHWTPLTRRCRGLVVTTDGAIVARGFEKFFGWSELPADEQARLAMLPFTMTEKWDGSLIILFREPKSGRLACATRGSFESEQAIHATAVFRTWHVSLDWKPERYTYLFEVIYPANHVVVDYGDLDDLVLLAALDLRTGEDAPAEAARLLAQGESLGAVGRLLGVESVAVPLGATPETLAAADRPNREGYVLRFSDGTLVKVKHPDYVRLHRLIFGLSERQLWECLVAGQDPDVLLVRAPEAFAVWVRRQVDDLRARHAAIRHICERDFAARPVCDSRKAYAEYYRACRYPHVLFLLHDGRAPDALIWKLLKPTGEPVDNLLGEAP